jgi:hypothetical protein
MPDLVRLYIRQTIYGFVIAGGFVGMLLWANVANLWYLVTHSADGILAVFLLWMFHGIVFSGVQFGIAIMRMADKDQGDDRGTRAPQHAPEAVPIRIATHPRR